jgi:protein-S-isoprenylcysteine O-methyltransferase Ste14
MEFYMLALAWAIYFFVHSFLATNAVKNWALHAFPKGFKYYRIAYNAIALSSIFPLVSWSISAENNQLVDNLYLGMLGGVIFVNGLMLLILAFRTFDGMEFLGFKTEGEPKLVQTGLYGYVRHPLYFATIVVILGLFLLIPTQKMLLTLGIAYTYILIGYRLEERKLVAIFGAEYHAYQSRIKALIPYII